MNKLIRIASLRISATTAVLLFSMTAGFAVALSNYHYDLNADTVVVYLEALIRWTPFYWGADRYGMLIPALTIWLRDPLSNVIVQSGLHATTAFVSFFLFARWIFKGSWLEMGALAATYYCALSGTGDLNTFLTPWQIYTPALMFGLLALLNLRRPFVCAIAFALGEWCNFASGLFLLILALGLGLERLNRIGRPALLSLRRQATCVVVAILFGVGLRRAFAPAAHLPTYIGRISGVDAVTGWLQMLHEYIFGAQYSCWMLLLPPGLALSLYGWQSWRGVRIRRRGLWRRFLAAQAAAIFYAMVVGASPFAKANFFPARYLIPSLMVWLVGWSAIALSCLPMHGRVLRLWTGACAATLFLCTILLVRFGVPSVGAVQRALAARLAPAYLDVAAAHCTHLSGDYYRVWESVLYARLVGSDPPLWGITGRSEVTKDLWQLKNFAQPRVCLLRASEAEAQALLRTFCLRRHLQYQESLGSVDVWVPLPAEH